MKSGYDMHCGPIGGVRVVSTDSLRVESHFLFHQSMLVVLIVPCDDTLHK